MRARALFAALLAALPPAAPAQLAPAPAGNPWRPAWFANAAPLLSAPSAPTNTPPPAATNTPGTNTPALPPPPPPRPAMGASGTAVLDAFGGQAAAKFSIAGRTLKLPAPPPVTPLEGAWRRHLECGLNLTRGNSDTLRYSASAEAVNETCYDLLRLRAFGASGESEGQQDTENMGAVGHYERQLTGRLYALEQVDWWRDTIAAIDYRVTGILSPGLHLVRSDATLLNVEAGAGYVEEKKDGMSEGYAAGRVAATAERILNAHVLTWCTAEYLPKLTDTGVFFVNAEAGVSSGLGARTYLNTTLQERYDSAPVDNKESSDLALRVSLGMAF